MAILSTSKSSYAIVIIIDSHYWFFQVPNWSFPHWDLTACGGINLPIIAYGAFSSK
jgi:hypothetical protein